MRLLPLSFLIVLLLLPIIIISSSSSSQWLISAQVVYPAGDCECKDVICKSIAGKCCGCGKKVKVSGFSVNCVAPDAGYSADGALSYKCPVGSFANSDHACYINTLVCQSCPAGSYSSSEGSSSCSACGKGWYGTKERATSKNDGCAQCPRNTFSDKDFAPSQNDCQQCPQGTTSEPGSSSCIADDCEAGSYFDSRAGKCQHCPAGTSNSQTGATSAESCSSCGRGKYAPAGSTSCQLCSPGRYNNQDRASSCAPCESGFVQPANGSTSCNRCPTGTHANEERTTCVECGAGYYYSEQESGSCIPCGVGKRSFDGTGSTSCVSCPEGTHQPHLASAVCYGCPAGTFSNRINSANCTDCGPGKYSSSSQKSTSCLSAQPGFYQPNNRSDMQLPCEKGSFSNATEASFCYKCRPGYENPLLNNTKCSACASGWHSPTDGTPKCLPCDYGEFSNTSAAAFCYKSRKGEYVDEMNSTSAKTCAPGSYADVPGLRVCKKCRAGSSMTATIHGSTSPLDCKKCSAGFYNEVDGATECLACPPGTANSFPGASTSAFCEVCPAGSFAEFQNSTACTKCEAGTASSIVGAKFADNCVDCLAGSFAASSGSSSCTPCPAATYTSTPKSTSCKNVGPGRYSSEGSSSFSSCRPGYYCPNSKGCPDKCFFCGLVNGYSTKTEATECQLCPQYSEPNETATGCFTSTLTSSPTMEETASASHERTVSEEVTETPSRELSHNSSSHSESYATPTKTRHTVSHNFTKSKSNSKTEGDLTQSINLNSSTISETLTRNTVEGTVTASDELSQSSSIPSQSRGHSATDSNDVHSPSINQTLSFSDSAHTLSLSEKTETLTKQIFEKQKPLGLSAAAAENIKQASTVASAVVGIASAPAAAAVSRSVAILSLIGCPERNPATQNYWSEDEVPFPASLIPGIGVGDRSRFHRGGVISFCVVFFFMTMLAFFNRESIGSSHGSRADEGNNKKKNVKDLYTKQQLEIQDWELDAFSGGGRTGQTQQKTQEEEAEEEEDKKTNQEEDDDTKKNLPIFEVSNTSSNIPQLIFAILSSVISLWSAQAGFLFATYKIGDILLATLPLAAILGFAAFVNYKMYLSINDRDHGIFFTPSHVLMKNRDEAECCGLLKPQAVHDLLKSPVGRFTLFGHYFWTRRKGKENMEAHRLLSLLGTQLQKFRGVVKVSEFVKTENPFDDDVIEHELETLDHLTMKKEEKNSKNNKNAQDDDDDDDQQQLLLGFPKNNNNKNGLPTSAAVKINPTWDWQEKEEPKIVIKKDHYTWSARVSPYYVVISWTLAATTTFLQGVGLASPTATCQWIARVIMIENTFSAILFLWVRPFVVPIRNWVMGLLEVTICISSILAVGFLLTNEENPHNDPEIAARLEMQSRVAAVVQVISSIVGNGVSFIMVVSTIGRIILLRKGNCSVATMEEMWANRKLWMIDAKKSSANVYDENDDNNNNNTDDMEEFFRRHNDSSNNKKQFTPAENVVNIDDVLVRAATTTTALSPLPHSKSNSKKKSNRSKKNEEKQKKKEDEDFLHAMLKANAKDKKSSRHHHQHKSSSKKSKNKNDINDDDDDDDYTLDEEGGFLNARFF